MNKSEFLAIMAISNQYLMFSLNHICTVKSTIMFTYWFVVFNLISVVVLYGLREQFSWTRITFQLNDNQSLITANNSIVWPNDNYEISSYIYENNIPMGLNKWRNKLFISIPRRRNGVPSTLNYIDLKKSSKLNEPLIPYPSLEANTIGFEQSLSLFDMPLASVYRTHIDRCNRLWMVDTGIIETLSSPRSIQPITVVIINLLTDRIVDRYAIKESALKPDSVPASITVDVESDCENAFAYIPDLATFGLIVFDLKNRDSWRFNHNFFYPDPLKGDLKIGNHQFQWNDGIFSIALSRSEPDDNFQRDAYFHAMASTNEFRVSTTILKNKTASERIYHGIDFVLMGDKGHNKQTAMSVFDQESNVLFYAHINRNAIGCWNSEKEFNQDNHAIVFEDDQKLIYPSDLIIDPSDNSLWVLSNNMPIFLYGKLNYDQINFRIWTNDVYQLINDTICNKY